MPNKIKCGESRKAYYKLTRTNNISEVNKKKRLDKHLKTHPTDEQSRSRAVPNYTRRNNALS